MKRIVTAMVIIICVLVPGALNTLAEPARADVAGVSLPTTATISSTTLTLAGTVRVSSSETGVRSASLWFRYPKSRSATLVGSATSSRPGFLAITAVLDATRIVPGRNKLRVIDAADGSSRIIVLDLRRQSRVSVTHAELRSKGRVALAVRVRHYDPKVDALIASRLSPVRLQEDVDGTWTTLTSVTTDKLGQAGAVVAAGPGVHFYRAVRPDGATVWSATSLTVRAGRGARVTSAS